MCDSYSVVWGVGCVLPVIIDSLLIPYLDIARVKNYYYYIRAKMLCWLNASHSHYYYIGN